MTAPSGNVFVRNGQEVYAPGAEIVIESRAADDVYLERDRFFIDGELQVEDRVPPFRFAVTVDSDRAPPYSFTASAIGIDIPGNRGSFGVLQFHVESDLDGEYIIAELDYQLPNHSVIASLTGIYGDWDVDVDRGYLNAGTPDQSSGDTDVTSTALRIRLDWLDALHFSGINISPRIGYTINHVDVDARHVRPDAAHPGDELDRLVARRRQTTSPCHGPGRWRDVRGIVLGQRAGHRKRTFEHGV